jgi:endonuclease YncB( thermonuclease family)
MIVGCPWRTGLLRPAFAAAITPKATIPVPQGFRLWSRGRRAYHHVVPPLADSLKGSCVTVSPRLVRWVLLLLAVAVNVSWAETLVGKVVAIADGDTLTVLTGIAQYKIRLAGIDAPEKRQPFGERSKQSLAKLAFGKTVTVEYYKVDRYGRLLGKVLVNGKDVNLEQVRLGMGWHYKQYEMEQSAEDRVAYAIAEVRARRERLGLWPDTNAIAPWDWRAARRSRQQ